MRETIGNKNPNCLLNIYFTFFETGNFFKIPFPNVDLFVIAAVLRSLTREKSDELISKCFKALDPGKLLICL